MALPHRLSTFVALGTLAILAVSFCYRYRLLALWYVDVTLIGFVLMVALLPFDRTIGNWFNLHYAPEMASLFGLGYFGGAASIQLPLLVATTLLSLGPFAYEKLGNNPNWFREAAQPVIVLAGSIIVGLVFEAIVRP